MSANGATKADLFKAIHGYKIEVGKMFMTAELLREVERRARFIVMLRENGLKHEPAWDKLVKALNALRAHDTAEPRR